MTSNNPNDITIALGKLSIRRRTIYGDTIYEFLDVQGVQRKLVDETGNLQRMLDASIEGSGELSVGVITNAGEVQVQPPDPRTIAAGPGLGPRNQLDNTRSI